MIFRRMLSAGAFLVVVASVLVAAAQPTSSLRDEIRRQIKAYDEAADIQAQNAALIAIEDIGDKLLLARPDAGESVIRDDFLLDKSGMVYANNRTMRDCDHLPSAAVIVAERMLSVAEEDFATVAEYRAAWLREEVRLLEELEDRGIISTDDLPVFKSYLKDWRDEVDRTASDRYQDALPQAAYSLIRVSKGIEQEHVEKARERVKKGGSASGGETTSSGRSSTIADIYPHMYRHHTRIMLRIERHSRR